MQIANKHCKLVLVNVAIIHKHISVNEDINFLIECKHVGTSLGHQIFRLNL